MQQSLDVIVISAIGDGALRRVHGRAAKFFGGDGFVGDGLHNVGTGDEHVARVANHEDEVRHRRRVDVAAGAWTHDQRNLRNDAGGNHIALKHLTIAAERRNALLNARAAGVEQADDRRAILERHILQLGDLLRMRLGQRAAEHGEVLREHEHRASVDGAPAGDDAVARYFLALIHAEIGAAMGDEHVELFEGAVIQQQVDAFARGQLAAGMLRFDALEAAAKTGRCAALFKTIENMLHGVRLGCEPNAAHF